MRERAAFLVRQAIPDAAESADDGDSSLVRDAAVATWDQVVDLLRWLGGISLNLLWAAVIVVSIVWLSGRLRRRLRHALDARTKGRNNLPTLVDNVLQIGGYLFAALAAFTALGADSTAFVQAFALITAAISLSLQDVLKNFVAGIYLLAEEPFRTGDRLEVAGQVGTVERINVRSTVLRNDRAQQVLVPNYQVFSTVVTNRTGYQLQTLSVDVTGIMAGLDTVLADHDKWLTGVPGLSTRPPAIELTRAGPDDCDLTLTVWVTPGSDPRLDVVRRLRDRFPEATLTIPA